jgi:hypothetical protein
MIFPLVSLYLSLSLSLSLSFSLFRWPTYLIDASCITNKYLVFNIHWCKDCSGLGNAFNISPLQSQVHSPVLALKSIRKSINTKDEPYISTKNLIKNIQKARSYFYLITHITTDVQCRPPVAVLVFI